jgi:very-short-patch-repair endonuclease
VLEDNKYLRRFSKQMRREPTPAESSLWVLLRNRRLVGYKFRRQHSFGQYILDYYCPAARLVIELDGDTHASPEGKENDAERQRYLKVRGIEIIRFWNTEVSENPEGVLTLIAEVCQARVAIRQQNKVKREGNNI